MTEQHEIEVTGDDLMLEESEFDTLFREAEASDIYVPNWVNKPFSRLYKFAYLQVKKDEDSIGMSSANRTKLIKGLMEMYYKKILENSQVEEEPGMTGLAVEGEPSFPVTNTIT